MYHNNNVILAGFVFEAPIPAETDGLHSRAASFLLTVEDNKQPDRFATLTIKGYDSAADRIMAEVKVGHYFITDNARLRSLNYTRVVQAKCPQCGRQVQFEIPSEKTEIITDDRFIITPKKIYPQSLPGVNKAFMLGNICTDILQYGNDDNLQIQYKLAIDRTPHEMHDTGRRADFIYVCGYGLQAQKAKQEASKRVLTLVAGNINQRYFDQNRLVNCPYCSTNFAVKIPNSAVELYISDVNYFNNYEKIDENSLTYKMNEASEQVDVSLKKSMAFYKKNLTQTQDTASSKNKNNSDDDFESLLKSIYKNN